MSLFFPSPLFTKASVASIHQNCENLNVQEVQQKKPYLALAQQMVEPEIKQLRSSHNEHLKGFRRLLLSLVEIKIRRFLYQDADILARELLMIYSNFQQPDIVVRLGHVCGLIAFARLSTTPEDAIKRWEAVLEWNRFYNPFEEEIFTCGVVYLFLSIIWRNIGNHYKSRVNLHNAVQVIEKNDLNS
ncbi:hypothetical protein LOZ58_000370 [Ophidiomyces ophidiicola]|nr:hypothetical protein LOZ65_000310 [Ophidiomyces ophidiicola]KAI1935013.1 hypothetical protein LOZ66_005562 [Ophidiomyces ophidiicola]KAI1966880.1 hypothetical protein LOZ58_000370 [Ophidiomyces ophidiicola]